jgi:hypothetical protein
MRINDEKNISTIKKKKEKQARLSRAYEQQEWYSRTEAQETQRAQKTQRFQ